MAQELYQGFNNDLTPLGEEIAALLADDIGQIFRHYVLQGVRPRDISHLLCETVKGWELSYLVSLQFMGDVEKGGDHEQSLPGDGTVEPAA